MAATKEQVLNGVDWDFKEIPVQGWGDLRVRSLSARERLDLAAKFSADKITGEDAATFFCTLIALSAVDADGKQLFDMNGDIEKLKSKGWVRIQYAASEIMEFNGIGKAEDIRKN